MDARQAGLGIVLLLVFWAYQAGWFAVLGTTAWFVGAIIFAVILMLIGRGVMPKPSAEQKTLWNFAIGFALVVTFIVSYLGPWIPGVVVPSDPNVVTPVLLSFWLVVFGGAMFVTGWEMKWGVTLLTGLLWLFGSVTWVLTAGPNAWIHFAILASFPLILYGLMAKK